MVENNGNGSAVDTLLNEKGVGLLIARPGKQRVWCHWSQHCKQWCNIVHNGQDCLTVATLLWLTSSWWLTMAKSVVPSQNTFQNLYWDRECCFIGRCSTRVNQIVLREPEWRVSGWEVRSQGKANLILGMSTALVQSSFCTSNHHQHRSCILYCMLYWWNNNISFFWMPKYNLLLEAAYISIIW